MFAAADGVSVTVGGVNQCFVTVLLAKSGPSTPESLMQSVTPKAVAPSFSSGPPPTVPSVSRQPRIESIPGTLLVYVKVAVPSLATFVHVNCPVFGPFTTAIPIGRPVTWVKSQNSSSPELLTGLHPVSGRQQSVS